MLSTHTGPPHNRGFTEPIHTMDVRESNGGAIKDVERKRRIVKMSERIREK